MAQSLSGQLAAPLQSYAPVTDPALEDADAEVGRCPSRRSRGVARAAAAATLLLGAAATATAAVGGRAHAGGAAGIWAGAKELVTPLASLRGALEQAWVAPSGQCGAAEEGVAYIYQHCYHVQDIEDENACCARCQATPTCMAWTWVLESGLMSSSSQTECYLKGGQFVTRRMQLMDGSPLPVRLISGNATDRNPEGTMSSNVFNYQVVHSGGLPALNCPQGNSLPGVWPVSGHAGVTVSVLTYNLGWWSLFDQARPSEFHIFRKTPGNGATKLLGANGANFDLMAFQECIDINWMLQMSGLASDFVGRQGPEEICFAIRKSTWNVLGDGFTYVAEDQQSQYWRRRGAQWVRLQHKGSNRNLLFVNHHGALPLNTGGACPGLGTAHNLIDLINAHAAPGDAIILVGDFNSGQNSPTIQGLSGILTKAISGTSFGGVDNIFSNLGQPTGSALLGTGGSDHGAVMASFAM